MIVKSRTTAVAIKVDDADTALRPKSAHVPSDGFAIAILAPILFGLAFVVRKWGLQFYPSAVGGAFIGAAAGMATQLVSDTATGQLRRRLRENLKDIPWWFVGAGTFTSVALLAQFLAFEHLPTWVVSLLQGTQVLWTLVLAAAFLKREERIDANLIFSIILVFVGVAAITSQY